jgi:hypothetical protein
LREPDPYNLGPDSLCQIDHVNKWWHFENDVGVEESEVLKVR